MADRRGPSFNRPLSTPMSTLRQPRSTNSIELTPSATGEKPRIYAIATHPGAVHTDQQDQFKEGYGKLFGTIMKTVTVPFMRSPEEGSYSTLWAATSDEVEKKTVLHIQIIANQR